MPLHAVVVTRPNAGSSDALEATLTALRAQTRAPDRITVIARGQVAQETAVSPDDMNVIAVSAATRFAEAISRAISENPGDDLWLLTDSISPEPEALHELASALERAPSAAIAAGKLVRHRDPDEALLSYGVTMTTYGRTVNAVDGEFDQGQYDDQDEALGSHIVGALLRGERAAALTPDDALLGADEGLDMGVRARLAGWRLVLAPLARLRVRGKGSAELSALTDPPSSTGAYRARVAQLHRRLSYAPVLAVLVHWLSFPFLALGRSIWHLIDKRPSLVWPEWAAAAVAMGRPAHVARSRGRIRNTRLSPRRLAWAAVDPLRVTPADERHRIVDGNGSELGSTHEVGYFSSGGAWTTLTALVVGLAAFIPVLAWPSLGGGALAPLSDSIRTLWENAVYGQRAVGANLVGPADPFATLMAGLGSLSPTNPSFALNVLWVLAIPLAATGAWFAATRITDRTGVRVFVALAWALAPTFLAALVQGRPHAVLAHILLAWLVHSASVAYRSWGAAGASSLLLLGTIAAAPSLALPLVAGWVVLVAVNIISALRHTKGPLQVTWPHRVARLLWLWVPTAFAFAPLIWWHLRRGSEWSLVVDPGMPWQGPQAASDASGRLELAAGLPDGTLGGWLGTQPGVLALLLLVPLALCALAAMLAPRWRFVAVMLGVGVVGIVTAWVQQNIAVNFAVATPVSIWPGTGVSLAWLGVVAAAALAIEAVPARGFVRGAAITVVLASLAAFAVPHLVSVHRGEALVTRGDTSTLPAFVAASARGQGDVGTLKLTPQPDGGFAADVVWGPSETIDGQATIHSTARTIVGGDLSQLVADLLSGADSNVVDQLSQQDIGFVLVAPASPDATLAARDSRLAAATALDQRAGLMRAGETDKGGLWPLEAAPAERAGLTGSQAAKSHFYTSVMIAVIATAVLLSLPTTSSRRLARAYGRPGTHADKKLSDAHGFGRGAAVTARWIIAAALPAALVLVVMAASALPEPRVTAQPPRTTVTPGAMGSTLVCTDVFRVYGRDTLDPTKAAAAGTFAVTTEALGADFTQAPISSPDLPEAGVSLSSPATAEGAPRIAAAQSVSLSAADVAGYAASACVNPRTESWIVGGSASLGASDVLLVTNPNPVPATADISILIPEVGVADITSQSIVIAAHSQRALPLSSFVVGQQSPVVRVVASGAPVDVQLQSTQMSVLVPAGIDQQASSLPPATELRVVGVQILADSTDAQPTARLRLMAPEADANVTVTLRASGAESDLGSPITALVPAGSPAEFNLTAPAGIYEVKVTSDAPVVGAVWQTTSATPPSDFAWTPAAPELSGEALFAVPGLPTGGKAQLHIAAAGEEPVLVTLTEISTGTKTQFEVPAGSNGVHDVAVGGYELSIMGTARAAVLISGPGALASWPIQAPAGAPHPVTVYQ